ncbi:MAG TPA: prolyl oligopeptidase family serine peptidase [Micromonosporaceae bacterium]
MEYPELAWRTHRFTAGAPWAVTISSDGARVMFLRAAGPDDPADRVWVLDPATGAERLVADPARLGGSGIDRYATDSRARVAALTVGGRLFGANVPTGEVVELPVAAAPTDARPDPTGRRIAYVAGGALHVVGSEGRDSMLAGESADGLRISWGVAEPQAAIHFGRTRGYWWAPDGDSILAARVDQTRVEPGPAAGGPAAGALTAEVTLHLLDLDGGWVDVHWDRETYPYLVAVDWSADGGPGGPLITVLRRLQQHGLVLSVDPRTGETQVHAELADPRWVEPIAGTPRHLADGRVLVGGELAHDGYDSRCLFADGTLLTPPGLYVRRVVGLIGGVDPAGVDRLGGGGRAGGGRDLLVEATEGEPSEQHLYRVRTAIGAIGVDARRLTGAPGWHTAAVGGGLVAIGAESLDHAGTQWSIWRGDTQLATIPSYAPMPPYAPRPGLTRVTDRRLPAAVLYPSQHMAGRRLPVLVDVYGVPGRQEVRAARDAWLERQWLADAGFAVVVVDNRGTPGVAPSFEKVVHRRLADVALADQVEALAALAEKHPDLDLSRVGVRGRGLGGWLAALAVLRRPDAYRCGVAESPVTDWVRYDAAYSERYLGLPDDGTDVYAHHSLVEVAAEPPLHADDARPLLIVDPVDDEHGLSAALRATGRPHELFATPAEGGAAVLRRELDFLRAQLGG